MATSTPLSGPGYRPLSVSKLGAQKPGGLAPANGRSMPSGTEAMTLGTLREVRNELASLGDLLDRMTKEMAGLRGSVQLMAERQERLSAMAMHGGGADDDALADRLGSLEKRVRKAAKREAKGATASAERDAATDARLDKLERQVKHLRRRVEWIA